MLRKLNGARLNKRLQKLRIDDNFMFEEIVTDIDQFGFNVDETEIRRLLAKNNITSNLVSNKAVISTVAFRLYLKHVTIDEKPLMTSYEAFLKRTDASAYQIVVRARSMMYNPFA